MPTTPSGRYIFRHAALQNYAVAENLAKIAARSKATRQDITQVHVMEDDLVTSSPVASSPVSRYPVMYNDMAYSESRKRFASSIMGGLIVIAGLLAIGSVISPKIYEILVTIWKTILLSLGGICIGSGFILMFGRIGKQPLKKVEPPDGTSEQPLAELEHLASRTVSRLRTAYRMQISLITIVSALLLFVVLWSIFMVTKNRLMYATAFGSSGIGMLVLSKWKWQPFERVAEARKLADDADILATGLRLRIKSISEITDPKERAQAQWDAVSEYLDRS